MTAFFGIDPAVLVHYYAAVLALPFAFYIRPAEVADDLSLALKWQAVRAMKSFRAVL